MKTWTDYYIEARSNGYTIGEATIYTDKQMLGYIVVLQNKKYNKTSFNQ